jgi:OFA family oxalate/formate antiporter-like MFS transporter
MVMVANLQYGWTLFVNPIDEKHQWGRAAIQVAFTIFVVTETWLVPLEGYLIDRFGPRGMVFVSGLLVGFAWVANAYATTLASLYAASAVAGIGAGVVYAATIGNALKWFPDRRGLATGLTAAGFGAGSAFFGILQGTVIAIVALFLRAPLDSEARREKYPTTPQTAQDYSPLQIARMPTFWVLYAMFILVVAGGLVAVAQLAPIAQDYGIDAVPVSLLGITMPALSFALAIDRVMNGVTRPIFGLISDRFGRENTMFVAFGLEGVGIIMLATFAHDPVLFVVCSGVVFFAWGEIYSLFPATCADLYGRRHATANYGLLYTAKGVAALLVPLANVIQSVTGNWLAILWAAAAFNFAAALLALFVLKVMRTRASALRLGLSYSRTYVKS